MPYDENFLVGQKIPLPAVSQSVIHELHQNGAFIHHTRISLLFNERRGFTMCSAHNIDGSSLPDSQWTNRRFKLDPDILPKKLQVGNKRGYWKNRWDRGHMARRKSMSWGKREEASAAELESDYYSNICPQHENLHDIAWGEIEDWMLGLADDNNSRACVFTGPVLTPDDTEIINAPGQKAIRIPAGFWKIIAVVVAGKVRAAGFLVWQRDYNSSEPFEFAPVLEQVRITTIEVLTGLTFTSLRKYDPLIFDRGENAITAAAQKRKRLDDALFESISGSPLELTEKAIERFSQPAISKTGPGIFSPADILL